MCRQIGIPLLFSRRGTEGEVIVSEGEVLQQRSSDTHCGGGGVADLPVS